MIASSFLHAYIVVQSDRTQSGEQVYRVSVTARDDVPFFGPALPDPAVFRKGPELREYLLTKLINAEFGSYRSEKFAALEERTRTALLGSLYEELVVRSQRMMGLASDGDRMDEGGRGFFENFKRAIRGRSQSFDTVGTSAKRSPQSGNSRCQHATDGQKSAGNGSGVNGRSPTKIRGSQFRGAASENIEEVQEKGVPDGQENVTGSRRPPPRTWSSSSEGSRASEGEDQDTEMDPSFKDRLKHELSVQSLGLEGNGRLSRERSTAARPPTEVGPISLDPV
ncbi:rap1 GTPase-activating protein 1-like [Heptranchias perlo]|uniref:rap1 GTPase-activating protein 1-like n=1 Tax=Heptranchias perlo TaxID=212740 RepID=UPI00355A9727